MWWLLAWSVWLVQSAASPSFEPYFRAMKAYWADNTAAAKCLRSQAASGASVFVKADEFLTLGLEGSGHHLFWNLGGGKRSFPEGWGSHALNGLLTFPTISRNGLYDKFLGLARDPVDSWRSVMDLFFRPYDKHVDQVDTIDNEFAALNASTTALVRATEALPCAKKLYMPYDYVMEFPGEARPVLRAFWGETDQTRRWFSALKERPSKDRVDRPSWPVPYGARRCGETPNITAGLLDLQTRALKDIASLYAKVPWLGDVVCWKTTSATSDFRVATERWFFSRNGVRDDPVVPRDHSATSKVAVLTLSSSL